MNSDEGEILTELRRLLAAHLPDGTITAVLAALRRTFGGERYYIPSAPDERRQEALRLLGLGHHPAEVARHTGLSAAHCYRLRQSARQRNDPKPKSTGLARNRDWLL